MSLNDYGRGAVAQGSPAACAVLASLNTIGEPTTRAEIERISGVPAGECQEALRGVRERGLAQVVGRGPAARWVLTRWVKEKRADVLDLIGGGK